MEEKKKGFTLIELLAVIIILAIIFLIATPVILRMIEKSRKGAAQDSAYGIRKTAQSYYQARLIEDVEGVTEEIVIDFSKELPENFDFDGVRPTSGNVTINKDGTIKDGSYIIVYNYRCPIPNSGKINCQKKSSNTDEQQKYTLYETGTEVFFNPLTGQPCNNYHDDNSLSGYNGSTSTKTTDNQTSCLKWYAYLDSESNENIRLILDHNTIPLVAWANSKYAQDITIKPMNDISLALMDSTNDWVGVARYDNYEYDGIDYSNYRARLISAYELAEITNNQNFETYNNDTTSYYLYFDTNTNKSNTYETGSYSPFSWLNNYTNCWSNCSKPDSNQHIYNKYDHVYSESDSKGYITGYWTSTMRSTDGSVWAVNAPGAISTYSSNNLYYNNTYGVRPVIEITKKQLEDGISTLPSEPERDIDITSTKYTTYSNGQIVYFNPISGKKCTASDVVNSSNRKAGCMKWYAFLDNEKNYSVNLILDHDISKTDSFSTRDMDKQFILNELKINTNAWIGANKIDATIDGIDYTNYYARLITADEISKIIGVESLNINGVCFEDLSSYSNYSSNCRPATGNAKFSWLFNNTNNCTNNGCEQNSNLGNTRYWTSTTVETTTNRIWGVTNSGSLEGLYVTSYDNGIRPVINVYKSLLK